MQRIAMLGSGFIADFYTRSIMGLRNRDKVTMVYSRSEEKAKAFSKKYNIEHVSTSMEDAITHKDVDVVVVGLPNHLHAEPVMLCAKHKKPVLVTKPLGRNATEAMDMLNAIEKAGVFGGYLEDLSYTPKTLKAAEAVRMGAVGKVLWARSRETHPGPHSDWFWDINQSGGGAILDLACHCIEVSRTFIGKDIKPIEVMCWADTLVKPIEAEDNAIGLVKYENGAIGQFEVSWSFRGGLDLRDEVQGTEGTIWLNHFLRTGFEMYTSGGKDGYVAEKSESSSGWIFPVGDEVTDLGYYEMFNDMFTSIEQNKTAKESFYDGYVVNAIMDAAYKSAKTKKWEPVELKVWRGKTGVTKEVGLKEYDALHYLVKEETLPNGSVKLILKEKKTGKIIQRER